MKKKMLFVLSLGLVLVLALTSCSAIKSVLPSTGGSNSGKDSNVLFSDDFSKTSSGWDQTTTDSGSTDYKNGAYEIIVNITNYDMWANPGLTFTDTRIEVDATKVAGSDNNDFGVLCRYVDVDNYYFAIVASDGFYGMGKMVDGTQTIFGDAGIPETDKVKPGSIPNHLRFDCVGAKLSFYANGNLLAEYEDSALTSGDVGLIAGTFTESGTDVSFDNFIVYKP
ncbi:MAG: hypothetical protein C0401_06800 [Anaerolinea sp.]|nr:hypothetical protein [Anaerolinea sp.]